MNQSYIRILQAIEFFCSEHLQIQRFASDFPSQLPNLGTVSDAYPVLFVSPSTSIFDENTTTFTLDIYCYDILQKDRSNVNTVLSDTNLILNDLEKWLRDGDVFGMELIETADAVPINNALLDYAAGWVMSITIQSGTYTICEIPFDNIPLVSGITNDVRYERFLTCESLAECSVIQDIYNQISGVTAGGQVENFNWKFNDDLGEEDPGTGRFSVNALLPSNVSKIYFNDICDQSGFDISNLFETISGNWDIYFQVTDNSTRFAQYHITGGTFIDNGGWWTVPVEFIEGSILPNNNARCSFLFINKNGGGTPTGTTITINGVSQDLSQNREWLTSQASTGILNFGTGLTGNTSTSIRISAMDGYIVNNETNPNIPTHTFVSYAGSNNVPVTTINSGIASYVLLDNTGTPYFQNTFPTSAERKSSIWLGKVAHPEGMITAVINEPDFITSPLGQFRDLFQALTYINKGVYPYPNGANTNLNITFGTIIGDGINLHNSNTVPNEIQMGPGIVVPFLYRTQTGGTSSATTGITGGFYDVSGATVAVPSTASTIQWIFCVPDTGFVIQFGQFLYPSLNDAVVAIGREQFVVFPSLIENAILIGLVALTSTATTLNDTSQAQFFRADKFGQIVSSQVGVSTSPASTLQQAYDVSTQPQITTNPLLGAVQIKGTGNNPIIQGLDISNNVKFNVTANGGLTASTISATTYLNTPFWTSGTGVSSVIQRGSVATANGDFGVSEGFQSVANGDYSHCEGFSSTAQGDVSHAEGTDTLAFGYASHSEGQLTSANGSYSHAEGFNTTAGATSSHAEGNLTQANGTNSHAEGDTTKATGDTSHSEGRQTVAGGSYSHAEGYLTQATGNFGSHAEGQNTIASNNQAHAEGRFTVASGIRTHAEGDSTSATTDYAHSEGWTNLSSGLASHTEGAFNIASGQTAHAEGNQNIAGDWAHAEGQLTRATGSRSHSEGRETRALGQYSHAEGSGTTASGQTSHSEGFNTIAVGLNSHAEGQNTSAIGQASHAEGVGSSAIGNFSHSEGNATAAQGDNSHAEGAATIAQGTYSHAEGFLTQANANYSHAEGNSSQSNGQYSHSEGFNTRANGTASHAGGSASTASGVVGFVHGLNSLAGTGSSIVVLGSNITGNTANNTYVDGLNIKTLGGGAAVTTLGRDVNGFIVTASTSSGGGSGSTLQIWTSGTGVDSVIHIDNNFTQNVADGEFSFAFGNAAAVDLNGRGSISMGEFLIISDANSAAFGKDNAITSGAFSSFVAGEQNVVGGQCSAAFGIQNFIGTPAGNSFVAGSSNTIDSPNSAMFGSTNSIGGGASNSIIAGSGNQIYANGLNAAIFGSNHLVGSDNCFVAGLQNSIFASSDNSVCLGYLNQIANTTPNCFIFGYNSAIEDNSNDSLNIGNTSYIWQGSPNSMIIGSNSTIATNTGGGSPNSKIIGSNSTIIDGSNDSVIIGNGSSIAAGSFLSLIVGSNSSLADTSQQSIIIGDANIGGSSTQISTIIGQGNGFAGSGAYSVLLGYLNAVGLNLVDAKTIGYLNIIEDGCNNTSILGSNNQIFAGAVNSGIIGNGSNVTAGLTGVYVIGESIAGTQSNTTFVDNFNIKTLGADPAVEVLGRDANGFIVSAGVPTPVWALGSAGAFSIKAINDTTTDATNDYAVAEGQDNIAAGVGSHAEGIGNQANTAGSHAEGTGTIAQGGQGSHAEGYNTLAQATASHAEGFGTQATAEASHAEGSTTTASGLYSHSQGTGTIAIGAASHAAGNGTTANGDYSFVHGAGASTSDGAVSFAHGFNVHAQGTCTAILGAQGITGALDFTTYVGDFCIKRDMTPPTSAADAAGEIGSITWDDTYFYVKTNNGWGRVLLDYGW